MQGASLGHSGNAASLLFLPPRTFFSGAAHAPGREGTSWRTDLTVANLTDRAVPAWLRFAADGGSGMDDAMIPVELPPLSSQRFDDVVRTTFRLDGVAGTVGLACAWDGVVSTARTYNDDAAGSYGQRLAPFDWKDALRFTEEGVLFPLRHESAAEPGWRTNVGISNDSPSGGTFRLDYLGAAGELLGSETLTIAGYGVLRLDQPFRRVTEADVPLGAIRVSGLEAGLALVPWASVVDNGTGDAVFLPAVKTSPCLPPTAATASLELAPSASSSDLYFPGFARAPGANGTTWRSELALWNDGDTAAPVELVWYAEGESPSSAQRSTLILAAGEARRIGDVVGEVFGRDGRGTLGVNAAGAPIRTSGRVYTSDSRGSYGQAVPPVASAGLLRLGQKGALLALSHRVSLDGGFRTNVGLWNGGSTGKAEVAFHRENGETLGCRTIDLPALTSVRLDGVLAEWTSDELVGAYATIDLSPTGAPAVAAWASTVDNRTGDAVFQPAQWHGGVAGGCE